MTGDGGGDATVLGELFAGHLTGARRFLDELAREHPDIDDDARIRRAKKRAVRTLSGVLRSDSADVDQLIRGAVADLAMVIVLVRHQVPSTQADFDALAEQLIASTDALARRGKRISSAVPRAASGVEEAVGRIQPHVAQLLFNALSGCKPSRPGRARDTYKAARSRVWRGRYDPRITEAVTAGATAAMGRAVDAAVPRLIVRMVERSLRPKSTHQSAGAD